MLNKIGKQILGVFLFLLVFVAATAFTGFGNDGSFSSPIWLNADARTRGRMADDLVAGGSLLGKNVDEIRSSLGAPDEDWGRVFQYKIDLGWPMKRSDTYGLQVHFDADQNVSFVKIVD